jgi:serine/threonine-protein kinase
MAEALEYAHEKSIIHRDLKPANVKITPEGTVKVLYFGLAKAIEENPTAADVSNSPTLSLAATKAGVILGTAAYMSPEQARGKAVDRRADVWAFGVVLYEILAGRRPFQGEDVSDTPAVIRELLIRCLERDPRQRHQTIGEARI